MHLLILAARVEIVNSRRILFACVGPGEAAQLQGRSWEENEAASLNSESSGWGASLHSPSRRPLVLPCPLPSSASQSGRLIQKH